MNYNNIKRILLNSIMVALLCNYCIYSQDCNDGYTYFADIPDNVDVLDQDQSNCFSDDDLAVLDSLIWVNELNDDSPLDIGNQTWAGERLKVWVATYYPGGDNGITQKITRLPDNFGQLSEIISLFLEKHDLTELPESFSLLSSLANLYISNNYITSLPEEFGNLTSLTFLDLGYNYLESIPESIGNLENLEYLFLFNNQLTSLPETICNLNLDWDGIDLNLYPYFACGGNFLCDSDLIPSCIVNSDNFEISMEQFYYSFILSMPQDCCPYALEEGEVNFGDVNGDGSYNVLDVVTLANCVLGGTCAELLYYCAADLNGDGDYNILDVVTLANCVLNQNCGN